MPSSSTSRTNQRHHRKRRSKRAPNKRTRRSRAASTTIQRRRTKRTPHQRGYTRQQGMRALAKLMAPRPTGLLYGQCPCKKPTSGPTDGDACAPGGGPSERSNTRVRFAPDTFNGGRGL